MWLYRLGFVLLAALYACYVICYVILIEKDDRETPAYENIYEEHTIHDPVNRYLGDILWEWQKKGYLLIDSPIVN